MSFSAHFLCGGLTGADSRYLEWELVSRLHEDSERVIREGLN
jgi:hypothetical protein